MGLCTAARSLCPGVCSYAAFREGWILMLASVFLSRKMDSLFGEGCRLETSRAELKLTQLRVRLPS